MLQMAFEERLRRDALQTAFEEQRAQLDGSERELAELRSSCKQMRDTQERLQSQLDVALVSAAHLRGERLDALQPNELADLLGRVHQSLERVLKKIATSSECVVCLSAPRRMVFMPCRHLCCCDECGAEQRRCPLCREGVETRISTFTG